ncbi:MAG: substrate-binding domain-containing protein [Spirochaetes bacterium]|nr:substrate-binding domain-containing protein [Spirochaetota bacterium]
MTALPTVKDIAERAQVSIGTVDRVLHGRGRVAEETLVRVNNAVRELGYKPNMFARHLSLARPRRFAVVMPRPGQDSGYWGLAVNGLRRARQELSAFGAEVHRYHYDRTAAGSFERAISLARTEGADAYLAACVRPGEGGRVLRGLKQPYVLFDSELPGTKPLAYIGQDAYASGRLAARLMQLIASGSPAAVIRTMSDDFHISARVRGFSEYYASHGHSSRIRIFDIPADGDERSFGRICGEITAASPSFRAIFVSNAEAHRVVHYLRLKKRARCSVIGYDLIEANARCVSSGTVDFIIDQRPDVQVYEGLMLLCRTTIRKEKLRRRRIIMPLDIITKENVQFHHS